MLLPKHEEDVLDNGTIVMPLTCIVSANAELIDSDSITLLTVISFFIKYGSSTSLQPESGIIKG